eukprot:5773442-Pyramimonas_sp.AAC.1
MRSAWRGPQASCTPARACTPSAAPELRDVDSLCDRTASDRSACRTRRSSLETLRPSSSAVSPVWRSRRLAPRQLRPPRVWPGPSGRPLPLGAACRG